MLASAHRVLATLDEPAIMGILNVTPDSFSDGGRYLDPEVAVKRALEMVDEGALIIDIGGESSRPGARFVTESEELLRVIPVIKALRRASDVPISIDTRKPGVMAVAASEGADLINDISALTTPGALEIAGETGLAVCLMHMQGKPRNMQRKPTYENVVEAVMKFLQERISACTESGIPCERLIVDPGFGFGKTPEHNLQLINELNRFEALGVPLLIGVSRKSTIAKTLGNQQLLTGSIVAAMMAVDRGASILRVHDVAATRAAIVMRSAIQGTGT